MFEGIITPIVTPFSTKNGQEINYEETDRLIDYLIEHGVKGIFPLGSNGEFHVLTSEERIAFAKHVIEYVNKRVPVYVGTGSNSVKEAIYLSQAAEAAGADALSVITPYFVKLRDEDIYQYYVKVAASVKIPIILYNIPGNTQNCISPEVYEKLAEIPNIKGIKDSSGKKELIDAFCEISQKYDLNFLIGSDSKISYAYEKGATGAIAGTSNLLTDNLVALDKALRKGDEVEAKKLQDSLEALRNVMHQGPVPSVLKKAVTLAKIADVGDARLPEVSPTPELIEEIKKMLIGYGFEL